MNRQPARNAPCPCGSGRKFKRCCGVLSGSGSNQAPGRAVGAATRLMKARMPDAWGWRELQALTARAQASPLRVVNPETGELVEKDSHRVCEGVELGAFRARVIALVSRAYRDLVEPSYGVRIEWFEDPQVLRYRPGGYYRAHADRDNWDPQTGSWRHQVDRDFSLLIYLDDDFDGGELWFPRSEVSIRPEPGMVIAFPSDHRFLHEAKPITRGIRHAVVSWAAAVGGPRVGRPGSDTLHRIER